VNAREVLRLLKADGWMELRWNGSHLQLKHQTKPGVVTLPMHASKAEARQQGGQAWHVGVD
jgi:predicted RNA binding protein YcfA (HicA-like mRNA interferase family)